MRISHDICYLLGGADHRSLWSANQLRLGRRHKTIVCPTGSEKSASIPFAGFLQLFYLSPDDVTLERAQMIYEENAVKVIDLMLESAR
jgi:hypothetical protein